MADNTPLKSKTMAAMAELAIPVRGHPEFATCVKCAAMLPTPRTKADLALWQTHADWHVAVRNAAGSVLGGLGHGL